MDVKELVDKSKIAIQVQKEVREIAKKDKNFAFGCSVEDFIILMQMLTPQSYGSRVQKRLIKMLGFIPISANQDSGDCEDTFGDRWEIKSSIINESNDRLNLVQIRPWQDIRGYICVVFDTRESPMDIQVYRLDKNQMKEECSKCKASSAHGTRKANNRNENIELRFSILIHKDDLDFQRWQFYRSKFNFRKC